MKNLLKIGALAILFIANVSCENDDQTIINPSGGPELLTPLTGSAYVLDPSTASSEATTLVWNHADYGVQTEVNYEVEFSLANTEFAVITSGGLTNSRFITFTHESLNAIALSAGLTPYTAGDLDLRIKSSLGTDEDVVAYSNIVTITVTPYTTDLPKLAVPGNHQGWSDANNFESAPRIAASGFGQTDYEGYMWLDGEFKFLAPNGATFAWGNTDYGDNGDFSGILTETGESNCSAIAGFYRVRANTADLTYTTTAVSWGIIGSATPNGWDSDTDFTYNPTTKKLEIASIFLVPGAFKFRGNNAWSNGFDLGTVNADGFLVDGGDLTFSGTEGNYKVILDLSNPRRYTYELIAL